MFYILSSFFFCLPEKKKEEKKDTNCRTINNYTVGSTWIKTISIVCGVIISKWKFMIFW